MTKNNMSQIKALGFPFIIITALLMVRFQNGVLLFHTLAELFAIFVGMLMLVVVLNTYHFIRNDFLVYLGIGYFSISILDAMHTFTVAGLPFFDLSGVEVTLHFWVYARLFEALLLLTAPLFLTRNLNARLMSVVVVMLLVTSSWAAFYLEAPLMFSNGGLSIFKIAIELAVIVLMIISLFIYFNKRALMANNVLFFIISSLLLTIAAELCFTLYTNFQGTAFVVGHTFKFLSFWMIYQAIVQTTLNEPLKLLTQSSNSYDAIPHPAIRTDQHAVIVQVNRAAIEDFSFASQTLVHKSIHNYFHPNAVDETNCDYCNALKENRTVVNEEVYFPQSSQWYLLSISPIDAKSAFAGMVQSLTNITQQKHQEDELIEHQELLEQRVQQRTIELERSIEQLHQAQAQLVEAKKMASLGGLVSGVAHEMNTPLSIGITAASYLTDITKQLNDDLSNTNLTRKAFNKYMAETLQCSQLIGDNLTRTAKLIQSFKQVAVEQNSDDQRSLYIKDYINKLLIDFRENLAKQKITLQFDLNNDFEVYLSPNAISQILTHIIDNALTHAFTDASSGVITVSIQREVDEVLLNITDSGSGILNEHQTLIYEPFFTTNRAQGGPGLGLHIVYNLVVHSLKGKITCSSSLEKGTTFSIRFPINSKVISN